MARPIGPRVRKAPVVKDQTKVDSSKDKPRKSRKSRLWSSLEKNPVVKLLFIALSPITAVLRVITPRYIKNSWREVRQVTWPNRRETWRLTIAVFIFAIVFGGLVALVDKGIDQIFKEVVLK